MHRFPKTATVALAAMVLVGCSDGEEPDAGSSGDRLVLTPPSDGAGHNHAPREHDAAPVGDGTTASAGGYRLTDVRLDVGAGAPGQVRFRILDHEGRPVTEYVEEQTKPLHLYVVRSDYGDFRHLHPGLADEGTWSAPVDLSGGGRYRVLAEFTPAGADRPVALGVTQDVRGASAPAEPSAAVADDGVVRVEVEDPGSVGADGQLSMLVSPLDGGGALPLGSYLGSSAHLTGFRTEGGEFVHVHPYGEPEETDDGTRLVFHTTFEEPGEYRMFLQVRVDGFLHTVPVSATVE